MVRESVKDGCVDILAKEHGKGPQDVVIRYIFSVSSLAYVVKDLLKDIIDHSDIKRQDEVDIILEEMDQVPLLAVLLSVLKEDLKSFFTICSKLLIAIALHDALLVGPVEVEINDCLIICEEAASLAIVLVPVGSHLFK